MDKEKIHELGLVKKSNAYYCSIFDNSMDAILLASPDGQICQVNPASCAMFHWTEEELCKHSLVDILGCDNPQLETLLIEREKTGKVRGELTFVRHDGSQFTGEFTSVLIDHGNQSKWSTTFIHDTSLVQLAVENEKKISAEAIRLANVDSLTGLLNRRAFMDRLKQETERAKREKSVMGLLIIDIDLFKEINDTYGHLMADYILQKFSSSLLLNSRPYDFIGRYSGDEFIVCLPNTNLDDSIIVAERMRNDVEKMDIFTEACQRISLTACYGVVNYILGEDVDYLIFRADCAIYKAKNQRTIVNVSSKRNNCG